MIWLQAPPKNGGDASQIGKLNSRWMKRTQNINSCTSTLRPFGEFNVSSSLLNVETSEKRVGHQKSVNRLQLAGFFYLNTNINLYNEID